MRKAIAMRVVSTDVKPQQRIKPNAFSRAVERALKRAQKRAREVARQHGTPIHVMRNGKIVALKP